MGQGESGWPSEDSGDCLLDDFPIGRVNTHWQRVYQYAYPCPVFISPMVYQLNSTHYVLLFFAWPMYSES